ncbi:hypothetical protein D7241_05160 [Stutzerimonas sp. VN223-3]|uniref:hypothetical protein n=1 Tax=Stutzerimonas sp. VN223-3 TaxID=3384601 RepID=UPI0038B55DF3
MQPLATIINLLGASALLISLTGCDAAEKSAQRLAEKAEQAVQDVAREAISGTVNELNKQVDDFQQSTNEFLGKPLVQPEEDVQPDEVDSEQPIIASPKSAIET